MSEQVSREIIRVAARGDGMTDDGRHAPFAAPGDQLLTDGTLVRGPHYRVPPCRHFPDCGGCQLQHLDDESYAGFLTDRISNALAAHDLSTEIRSPILSPPRTRRRATLHAERRGRQVHIGFTEEKSHHLIDIAECDILHPALFALIQPLRGLLAAMLSGSRRVDVQLTLADQGPDIIIKGQRFGGLQAAEALNSFAHRHKLARLCVDEGMGPEPRFEPEPVTISLSGVPVGLPPGSFLQATEEGENALVASAREIVGDASTVADLFAGLGTFTFAMTSKTKVYAAEAAREAIMSLKSAAGMSRRQIFADHRDLYRRPVTSEDLSRFEAVLLDPPRAGAKDQADQLASATTPTIGYISCNPSTFARDAQVICEGGYTLDWVQPVGQFKWSTHAELVARFSR